jgi:hypothetical protein
MRVNPRLAVILAAFVVLTAACSSRGAAPTTLPTAVDCRQLAADIVDEAQRFVDQFARSAIDDIPGEGIPGMNDLDSQLQAAVIAARDEGCEEHTFDNFLEAEVGRLRGKGPVGRPLVAAMQGFDPASAPPGRVVVDPSVDLAGVLFAAGPGSVIALSAGIYELDELVLVERSLALEGTGLAETVIRSSASGAAIYYRGAGVLELTGLTVEHTGSDPASVVVVADGSFRARRIRLTGGITDPSTGSDGHGLALAPSEPPGSGFDRTVTVTDSEFDGNDRIGVAVLATEPVVTTSSLHDNGFCGVCFFGRGGGLVSGSVIERNQVGVGSSGTSAPTLRDNDIRGNDGVGVLVEDDAAPIVEGSRVAGNGESGIDVSDASRPQVHDNEIEGHVRGISWSGSATGDAIGNLITRNEVGVVVGGSAAPLVGDNRLEANTALGVSVGDQAAGTLTGNTLTGHALGIRATGTATTVFVDNEITSDGGTGALLVGSSEVTLRDTIVTGHEIGIQVGGDAAPTIDDSVLTSTLGVGVIFTDRAEGSASNNTVTGHDVGYQVIGASAPSIVVGEVAGAAIAGIIYGGSGAGSAARLVVTDTDVGFVVGAEAHPDLRGNTVIRASTAGIVYRDQAAGTASRNYLSRIGSVGIQVGDDAAPALEGNTITAGPAVGLLYRDNAAGAAAMNAILGEVGVRIGGTSRPSISANTIWSTGTAAVIFTGSSGGGFKDNTVRGADEIGIQVGGSAAPAIGGNRVSGGTAGMLFGEDARGSATGNDISGVEIGIQAIDQSAPTVVANVFSIIASSSIVFLGASGTIDGNVCPDGAGIVILSGADPEVGDNDCEVITGG